MQEKRLGWDREHLVYVPLGRGVKGSYNVLKNELVRDSHVLGVSATTHLPSNIGSNSSGVDWDGKDPELTVLVGQNYVDFDFVGTLGIEMAEGRSFSREYANDDGKSFIVNEEVAKIMGKDSPVGERFNFYGVDGTIVGVMKNFHFKPIRDKIEPIALIVYPERTNFMLIRISPGNVSDSLKAIEDIWKKVIPGYPFESYFMDEDFDRMYRTEEKIGTLLQYFAILAMFIACLGLFGLASFTAEQRTKEIGIRKVLGASVGNITSLLCREFLLLVILANAIAWPVAYFAMKRWLQSYAYRTHLEVLYFLAALGVALGVAVLSVGFQAVRAATSNPTDSLRYE
jgi:ABC-type antimicrobial peptide transport system permease subunit